MMSNAVIRYICVDIASPDVFLNMSENYAVDSGRLQ